MPDCLLMKNSTGYTPLHLACEMFLDKESSMDFYRDCALALFEYAQTKGEGKNIEIFKQKISWQMHVELHKEDFVAVALLFYVHVKHLRSCRDGQLT